MQLRRAINDGIRQSLNISGKAPRRDYWPYVLLLGLITTALVVLLEYLTSHKPRLAVNNQVQHVFTLPSEAFGIAYAAMIFGTVSFFSASTRRLRDAALSPWLSLVAIFLVSAPALMYFISTLLPSNEVIPLVYISLYWAVFISPAVIVLMLLLCLAPTRDKGTTSPNEVRQ